MSYILLILGLVTLLVAGEFLVKGAVSLAYKFRISTLVVGMTIVSFGTSAPELIVSVKAVFEGYPDISIGNVVGSNIANLALVLGVTALVYPIAVERSTVRKDWPVLMFASILLYVFMLDGQLVMWEGLFMFTILVAFTIYLIRNSRKENKANEANKGTSSEIATSSSSTLKDVSFIVLGCIGLAFGADWLVEGAVDIARSFGVSDLVISVTIVAFGTSAPELITSIVAATKKQADISIGNLIGSNIFNILAILGITSSLKTVNVSEHVMNFDMLWVLGIAFLIFPFMLNKKITRWEGAILFLVYISYIVFTIM